MYVLTNALFARSDKTSATFEPMMQFFRVGLGGAVNKAEEEEESVNHSMNE